VASAPSVTAGQSVQLTATFSGGTGAIDHGVGAVQSGASISVSPAESTNYTLYVTASSGTVASSTVSVATTGATCTGKSLLSGLGRSHVLAGAAMSDASAAAHSFDARYLYLAGGLFDGSAPCSSCASSCSAAGHSCANAAGGCGWWGCFQYDQNPPGEYVRDFIALAKQNGQIPWFTYYEILQASNTGGNPHAEVTALSNQSLSTRVLNDLRFLFQQIGNETAFVHLEPDFWGFAQQSVSADPTQIPVPVQQVVECAGQPQTLVGFSRCVVAMARKYSPNVRIGFHGSVWATGNDVSLNTNPALDVAGEARKLANFLNALGAGAGDFIAIDASDRDAGYYASIGQPQHAWDATNQTLPNFHQAFAWAKALAESTSLPILYWQVPVGNAAQNNTTNHWVDNRVDYFYAHTNELAAAHIAGMLFGAGDGNQTTLETDGANVFARQAAYVSSGGQPLCP
jgi:hypothetical protein